MVWVPPEWALELEEARGSAPVMECRDTQAPAAQDSAAGEEVIGTILPLG